MSSTSPNEADDMLIDKMEVRELRQRRKDHMREEIVQKDKSFAELQLAQSTHTVAYLRRSPPPPT